MKNISVGFLKDHGGLTRVDEKGLHYCPPAAMLAFCGRAREGLPSQLWGWDKAGLCEKLHRWLLPEHTRCHKLARSCGHPDSEGEGGEQRTGLRERLQDMNN